MGFGLLVELFMQYFHYRIHTENAIGQHNIQTHYVQTIARYHHDIHRMIDMVRWVDHEQGNGMKSIRGTVDINKQSEIHT